MKLLKQRLIYEPANEKCQEKCLYLMENVIKLTNTIHKTNSKRKFSLNSLAAWRLVVLLFACMCGSHCYARVRLHTLKNKAAITRVGRRVSGLQVSGVWCLGLRVTAINTACEF